MKAGEGIDNLNDANGLIAYGTIFASVLTVVEMAELMWKPASLGGAQGYWPLWGDSTEIDLSGNGRTGTVTGSATSTDGPPVMFGGGLPL